MRSCTSSAFILSSLSIRKLEHPHIVKFHGTSLLKDLHTVQMILVMEKCREDLWRHISQHPESVPAKSKNVPDVREVCRWVKEITDGLDYIHKQGVVHRDLKLGNILV